MRDSELFDQAVAKFFEPIARELELPLAKIKEGVYEIQSSHFILRLRLHTGHARGLNAMLRPASLRHFDENEPSSEYGIGCFMEFHGEKPEQTFIDVNTNDDFLNHARLIANAVERFAVPYLLGEGKDFEDIQEMVRTKTEQATEKIKNYRFPKNVRKEWL